MLKNRVALIAGLSLFASVMFGCKKKTSDNYVKDFAYSSNGKNFAVVAGYGGSNTDDVIYDVSNWTNLLKREQLGKFDPVYIQQKNATVAGLKAVFKKIGEQVDDNSTIMFAYSGPGKAGSMVADQPFTYNDLADALRAGMANNKNVTKVRRFYLFIESALGTSDPSAKSFATDHIEKIYSEINTSERSKKLFEEILAFVSVTTDTNASDKQTASYYGRFSYEFAKAIDEMITKIRAGGSRPTLLTFFNSIVAETNKSANRQATYRLRPDTLKDESLFPEDFVPPVEPQATQPATTTPVAATPATTTPATTTAEQPASSGALAPSLNLPLQSNSGATNLNQVFKGKAMLVEVSASWCGPCQSLAQQIATAAKGSSAVQNGTCSHATLIVTDNGSTLSGWNQAAGSEVGAVSYQTTDSNSVNQWLSGLGGQSVQIQYFPTLFLVDTSGQVQSVGQSQALSSFVSTCP